MQHHLTQCVDAPHSIYEHSNKQEQMHGGGNNRSKQPPCVVVATLQEAGEGQPKREYALGHKH